MGIVKTQENVGNVVSLSLVSTAVELFADFSVKSKHHHYLCQEFNHPKAGLMVHNIEWLSVKHKLDGIGGLELNVLTRGKFPKMKTLCERVKMANRKSVFNALDEIRVSYNYAPSYQDSPNKCFDPDTIDFQDKYYACYYSRRDHVVVWYRNVKKFNELVARINAKVAKLQAKKQAKKELADTVPLPSVIPSVIPCCNPAVTLENPIVLVLADSISMSSSKPKTSEQENKEPQFSVSNSGTDELEALKKKNPEEKEKLAPKEKEGEASCVFESDPYTVYRDVMFEAHFHSVPFTKKLKADLKQLKSNFNQSIQQGILCGYDCSFAAFVNVLVKDWLLIKDYYQAEWDWMNPQNIPEPRIFMRNGGEDVIHWFSLQICKMADAELTALKELDNV